MNPSSVGNVETCFCPRGHHTISVPESLKEAHLNVHSGSSTILAALLRDKLDAPAGRTGK
ncbi:hypothetical protein PHISCL_04316 [Aspergillus sclerotialis]|uniref:Uncharacterized protein n=1 Tax=Aspergillus sclerotialis TaxID=2070753 RepID=A0A3A2ZL90_9EURO|nr:hypothetical protein PHISCL_04316 [Aspergillus sclerotialis]